MILTIALAMAVQPFNFQAQFIESCSCKGVCVTEITGRDAGCHGVGAFVFQKGFYGGQDISGSAAAFAWDSGKWVRLYVDAPPARREHVTALIKAFVKDWGTLEGVQAASIFVGKAAGRFTLSIGRGRIASIDMKPVFGAGGKEPVTHANLASPLHSTLMQGETVSATFADEHPFTLKGSNGFFNYHDVMKGRL